MSLEDFYINAYIENTFGESVRLLVLLLSCLEFGMFSHMPSIFFLLTIDFCLHKTNVVFSSYVWGCLGALALPSPFCFLEELQCLYEIIWELVRFSVPPSGFFKLGWAYSLLVIPCSRTWFFVFYILELLVIVIWCPQCIIVVDWLEFWLCQFELCSFLRMGFWSGCVIWTIYLYSHKCSRKCFSFLSLENQLNSVCAYTFDFWAIWFERLFFLKSFVGLVMVSWDL